MYGFAKSERDTIDDNELVDFRELASLYLAYKTEDINTAIDAGMFFEIEELVI